MTESLLLSEYPILYSFRRCPYAMRARLAIAAAGLCVELREVVLRDKPQVLLDASPKGTVPVLVLPDGNVLDQSLDIMLWALNTRDPEQWLLKTQDASRLIAQNDGEFKYFLDRYKYADRFPEQPAEHYRTQAETFLQALESRLQHSAFLCGEQFGLADAAIAPFIRQFAAVDEAWLAQAPYPLLRHWLQGFLAGAPFRQIMQTYQPWHSGDPAIYFPPHPDWESP